MEGACLISSLYLFTYPFKRERDRSEDRRRRNVSKQLLDDRKENKFTGI